MDKLVDAKSSSYSALMTQAVFLPLGMREALFLIIIMWSVDDWLCPMVTDLLQLYEIPS